MRAPASDKADCPETRCSCCAIASCNDVHSSQAVCQAPCFDSCVSSCSSSVQWLPFIDPRLSPPCPLPLSLPPPVVSSSLDRFSPVDGRESVCTGSCSFQFSSGWYHTPRIFSIEPRAVHERTILTVNGELLPLVHRECLYSCGHCTQKVSQKVSPVDSVPPPLLHYSQLLTTRALSPRTIPQEALRFRGTPGPIDGSALAVGQSSESSGRRPEPGKRTVWAERNKMLRLQS